MAETSLRHGVPERPAGVLSRPGGAESGGGSLAGVLSDFLGAADTADSFLKSNRVRGGLNYGNIAEEVAFLRRGSEVWVSVDPMIPNLKGFVLSLAS